MQSRFIKEIDEDIINKKKKEEKKEIKTIGNMYNTESNLKAGDHITHPIYGSGIIISINNNIASIAFRHGVGIKQIAANHKSLKKE
jgi:hypothetical protein